MSIKELLGKKRLYLDGGMGTMLQRAGLAAGELPERWNLTHPDEVTAIHAAYLEAGANIVTTNTFGAYRFKYSDLEDVIAAAVANARRAAEGCTHPDEAWVAYDVGPLGKLLEPMGDLSFEEAVSIFADSIRIAVGQGVDLIIIETMNDAYETKAAVVAAKECCELPIFVTNVFDENGRLLTGADCRVMANLLESLGVDAVGMNCSLGPHQMAGVAKRYLTETDLPVIVSPNAGLPRVVDGKTVYDVTAEEFGATAAEIAGAGAAVLGGCCGTDPEFIRCVTELTRNIPLQRKTTERDPVVTSYCKSVALEENPFSLGEPLAVAGVDEDDLEDLADEAMDQLDDDVEIITLDLTGAQPGMAALAVRKVQELVNAPLALLGSGAELEEAMRAYNGKPLVLISEEDQRESVFPPISRYGGKLALLKDGAAVI